MKRLMMLLLFMMGSLQAQTIHSLINTGEFIQAYELGLAQANVSSLTLAARAATFYADYQAQTEDKPLWYEKAERVAQQALTLDSNYALAYLYLAQAQGRLGQYRGILQSLNLADAIKRNAEKALELDPSLNEAKLTLAIWHSELVSRGVGWLYDASASQALALMDSVSAQEAQTFLFHLEYGNILTNLNRLDDATQQYQIVLNLTPQVATDYAMLELAKEALAALESR